MLACDHGNWPRQELLDSFREVETEGGKLLERGLGLFLM